MRTFIVILRKLKPINGLERYKVNTEIKLILNIFLHCFFLLACISLLINGGFVSLDQIEKLIELAFDTK